MARQWGYCQPVRHLSCLSGARTAVLAAFATRLPELTAEQAGADGELVLMGVEVIPAPSKGAIKARDGRTLRIPDIRRLVTDLNAQEVDARVDFDHQTEQSHRNYQQQTAAIGWTSDYGVSAAGGVEATLRILPGDGAAKVRSRAYRYLSPGLWTDKQNRVTGMSSVALVNNPALDLPALHSENAEDHPMDENELKSREDKVKADRAAADAQMLSVATIAVDQAVEGGKILPAQKDLHLASIKSHKDGMVAGLTAFNALMEATEATATDVLSRRISPRGKPGRTNVAASITLPPGIAADESRLELLAQVRKHAADNKLTFAAALEEYSALHAG